MTANQKLDSLIDGLGEIQRNLEAKVKQAKRTAAAIQTARNIALEFRKETTAELRDQIDLDLVLTGIKETLITSDQATTFLLALNLASTTTLSLSSYIAEQPATGGATTDYSETKHLLESCGTPIQSLHGGLAEKLKAISPHLERMLTGAKDSLEDTSNPLRFSNTALNLRELVRELLASLAPDDRIKLAKWYKNEGEADCGVTRKQRLLFAIHGYVNPASFGTRQIKLVTSNINSLLRTIDRLSKYTHTTERTLCDVESSSFAPYREVLLHLSTLLEMIDSSQAILADILATTAQEIISNWIICNDIEALMTLASHVYQEMADCVEVTSLEITPDDIHFEGSGYIYCKLQQGSNSDCRRGDGSEWEDSFPFSFNAKTATMDIEHLDINFDNLDVDTSKYYESEYSL